MRFLIFAVLAVLAAASRRAGRRLVNALVTYVRRYRTTGRRRPAPVARYRRGARVEDPFGLLDRQWTEAIARMARRREGMA